MSSSGEQRQAALRARRSLDAAERARASSRIVRRFARSHLFYRATVIGCYLPMADEVDTLALFDRAWSAGKTVCVPVMERGRRLRFVTLQDDTPVVRNRYGIWEPDALETLPAGDLDVCIVPTVAFDARANRIGMGGGYYDRAFEFVRRQQRWLHPKLVGFAFDCQRVNDIHPAPWDVSLYRVMTESQVVGRTTAEPL